MVGLSDIPFVGTALDRLSNVAVDAVFRGLPYMLCYKSFVNNLTSEIENVKLQEARVSRKIEEETNSGKTIQDHVTDWKEKVEEIKTLPEELSRQTPSLSCFNVVVFPNPVTRFRLGREAAHKAKYAAELTVSGVDLLKNEIADLPADPNMPISDTKYQKFESRNGAYGKLWEALVKVDGPPIIGIYGMPGVGKTRMMEKAWEHAKDEKIFDKVTRANVGNGNIDVIKLQNQLADSLDCRFVSQDNEGRRASQLKSSLIQAGKTLVILDDVWEEIHLEKIGIPRGDNIPKGCKILLTSRDKNVCLNSGCNDPIEIHILTVDEAWDMFKNTVGASRIDCLQDTSLAKQVCDECGRLPLLIQAVGNAIRVVSKNSWKHALSQLQNCRFYEVEQIDRKVYACIRWSFDKLNNDAKRCLLLCSLFEEDVDIDIKMLEDFAIGSQLLSYGGNVAGVVDILKSSSLLLKGKTSRTVKLHDIILDVARSIAAKDQEYEYLFISGGSCLPNNVNYRTRKLLQFVDSDNFRFPSGMVCPDLHTLWLEYNNKPQHFSKSFFEGILNLKILVLKGMPVFSEKMPVQNFDNLSMLVLDGCVLNEKWLSNVPESLETLIVLRCGLPDPLDLSRLKYLRKLEVICDGQIKMVQTAISTLPPTLVQLHIPKGLRIFDAESKRILVPISSELNKLTALTSLNIWLEDLESCPNENIVANLLDFIIDVGDKRGYTHDLDKMRSVEFRSSCIDGGGEALLERAEEVILVNVKGLVKGFSSSNREAFANLERLRMVDCEEMEGLVEWKAENEIQHSQPLSSFSNLTYLYIHGCRGLKYLFPASVGKCLVQLERLIITNCGALEVVIRKERVIDDGMIINFPNLRHLTLKDLPSLRRFYGENRYNNAASSGSDCLFDGKVSFPKLVYLDLTVDIEVGKFGSTPDIKRLTVRCDHKVQLPSKWELQFLNIEYLILKNCWWNEKVLIGRTEDVMLKDVTGSPIGFRNNNTEPFSKLKMLSIESCDDVEHLLAWMPDTEIRQGQPLTSFSKLTSLQIESCSGLKYLFCASVAKCLVQLQKLKIRSCSALEVVVRNESLRNESLVEEVIIEFPKLKELDLQSLPSLTRFYQGKNRGRSSSSSTIMDNSAISPSAVSDYLFDDMVQLPALTTFTIWRLKTREIWKKNYYKNNSFSQLERVNIHSCNNLEFVFPLAMLPTFENLKDLCIKSCTSMRSEVETSSTGEGSNAELQQLLALRSIQFSYMDDLEQTGLNSRRRNLYPNLETLDITYCRSLRNVFLPSTARDLLHLKKLDVRDCKMMRAIIGETEREGVGMNEFVFPKLTELRLMLPKLKGFYFNKSMEEHQSNLSTRVSFPRLELLELHVKDIKLDEIELGVNDSASEITKLVVKFDNKIQLPSKWQLQFPNREELSLYNCQCDGSFCIFNNTCKEGGGNLLVETAEEVMLEDVKSSTSGFSNKNRKIEAFSNMTKLSIQSCEGIEHLACLPRSEIDQSQPLTSFSKLTSLDINKCSGLKYLFSASVAKCLVELQRLVIQNCPTLEVVIRNESTVDGMIIKFPKLELLTLWNLDSFQRFYRDDRGRSSSSTTIIENTAISPDASESPFDEMVSFPNVEILKFNVKGSSNFLSNSNIDSLTKLKRLCIGSCEDREALACIPQYEIQQSQSLTPFSELSRLYIHKCSGLKYLFCVSVAKCLVQLQELCINDCPTLEVVIHNESAINGVIIEFPKLKNLGLTNLQSLRRFYGEKRGTSSSSTTIMENAAISSDASESLFNATVAFPALESLSIINLKTSEIWKNNSFSQLKLLVIYECHNLDFAIPLAMLPKFYNLENLYIGKCDSMSEIIRKEENEDELVFLELTGLYLKELPNFKSFCLYEFGHQFHLATKVFFPKLLELEFYYVNPVTLDEIELSKGDSTSELKKLDVRCHNEHQLPSKWQLQLPKIKKLKLKNCMWHGSSGEHDVQQLLINPYGTPSFQSLKVVEVRNCGLSALFSCSVFTNLHQLKKLKVKHCPLLEEVVTEEDNIVGAYENPISLMELEYIELKHLPKLISFSRSASYAFNLPALKSVVLHKCHQMENFTFLEISTPSMPDFNSQMEKYLSNPNEGNEEDSSDSESDNNPSFDESDIGEWFDTDSDSDSDV